MTGHIHAENMRLYAEDALTTDRPWDLWQVYGAAGWSALYDHPHWYVEMEYRRAPRTININGIEVPEPCRTAPEIGIRYWMPNTTNVRDPVCASNWTGDSVDRLRLKFGIVHLTREAAEIHAQALLSLTEVKS